MIRDFDPDRLSAKMPAVLMLGYALTGDRECASRLGRLYLDEDEAAIAAGRQSQHDDYVRAWLQEARQTLIAEGIARPTKREIHRKLGLIREGKHGNAPSRRAALRTYAKIERAKHEQPHLTRYAAMEAVAAELEDCRPLRRGAASKVKTVDRHQTVARELLASEVGPAELAAFCRGALALSRLEHRSEETEALLANARARGLIHV